ncbi:MAG: YcjX family protein [Variibacter sp.]|nr:YcjX family protein [Variibacter sp.]
MNPFWQAVEDARLAATSLVEFGAGLLNPTLRVGVTGLSRSGKTVFLTALIHNLMHGGRLPVFEAMAQGRISRAVLEPQPDDAVPRFDYETHIKALTAERRWPESTRRVSELRLVVEYQSARASARERTLTIDLVDYPGEWLLDLPLLDKTYAEWSAETLRLSYSPARAPLAAPWHAFAATLDPAGREDEQAALTAARLFTDYLRACRQDKFAMSLLPPGRFLMPGDLEGSPALTFVPLARSEGEAFAPGSLWAMMERRYEAYKDAVVRPFFRDHFARLDRQIVLVDALAAFNAGPDAVRDLQATLTEVLGCFRVGRRSLWSTLVRPRVDRILFAATKADHLHHISHDRLERILARMVERAAERAKFSGALIDVVAVAAVRATREATIAVGGERLPSIVGTPMAGESAGPEVFDGDTETAVFPGDLPEDPAAIFDPALPGFRGAASGETDYRFLRFRPPRGVASEGAGAPALPHIRLDRALQFLLGDRLR